MSESQDKEFVKLNVGGEVFCTTLQTLMKGDTIFSEMFSDGIPTKQGEDGSVFIDRDGTHFRTVLNFLRDGSIPKPTMKREVEELKREAEFYRIESLVEYCNTLQNEEKFGEDTVSVGEVEFYYYENNGHSGRIRNKYANPFRYGIEMLLPLMENGTLSLSVLQQVYKRATGLCYMNKKISNIPILLKVCEGMIYPPEKGWDGIDFFVVPCKNSDTPPSKYANNSIG